MKQAVSRLMRRQSHPNSEWGMSLPEVMISSFILVSVVTANMHMGNSSVKGMNSSDLRYKLDSAMAQRIEDLRKQAFEYLCVDTPGDEAGCIEGHSNKALAYDLTVLKPLCITNNLGEQLRNHINTNTMRNKTNNGKKTNNTNSQTKLSLGCTTGDQKALVRKKQKV